MRLHRQTVLLVYLQILITFLNYKKSNALEEWSKLRLVQVVSASSNRYTVNYAKIRLTEN